MHAACGDAQEAKPVVKATTAGMEERKRQGIGMRPVRLILILRATTPVRVQRPRPERRATIGPNMTIACAGPIQIGDDDRVRSGGVCVVRAKIQGPAGPRPQDDPGFGDGPQIPSSP
jgi:hypothetical protein